MPSPRAQTSLELDGPIERVWSALTELDRYAEWNPFIVRVEGAARPEVGARLVLHVAWEDGGGFASGELVTRVEPPGDSAVLAWRFHGLLSSLNVVRAERVQRLTALAGGRTRYESEEVFTGLLAAFVPLARVQRGFERQAAALGQRFARR